jgi:hypothetical protein
MRKVVKTIKNLGGLILIVIAAFPGMGKTTMEYLMKGTIFKILDLNSSAFSKSADFPKNYVDHLQGLIGEGKFNLILISTHEKVLKELWRRSIDYLVVYPDPTRKEEFLENYKKRGDSEEFINKLELNWYAWIRNLDKERDTLQLSAPKYLMDITFENLRHYEDGF